MRLTNRVRVLAMAAGVAASLLAFGARPAQAALTESDNGAWTKIYGMQEGASPLTCGIRAGDINSPDQWSCSTPSTNPLVANGADCTQTVDVNLAFRDVQVPVTGCTAELSNVSWSGDAACATVCQADGALGTASFTFEPVVGSGIFLQPAIITEADCSGTAGHATVTAEGVAGGVTYDMKGSITWVGSCTDTSLLTWAGTVTIV